MGVPFNTHTGHFLKFILGIFWFKQCPLTEFARMNHLATDLQGLVNDRVIEGFVFDVIVVKITASTDKNKISLNKKSQHFIERGLHTCPISS